MNNKLESFATAYKNYKQINGWFAPLNKIQYLKLMNGFSEHMMEEVIKGKAVAIPEKLGFVQVVGKKTKIKVTENGIEGLTPDWISTKKLWSTCEECKLKKQKIFFFNEHSNGLRFRFMWSRNKMLLWTKKLYTYVPNRNSKKKLFKAINDGTEYQLIEGRFSLNRFKSKNL